jgi:hypothetical protein
MMVDLMISTTGIEAAQSTLYFCILVLLHGNDTANAKNFNYNVVFAHTSQTKTSETWFYYDNYIDNLSHFSNNEFINTI